MLTTGLNSTQKYIEKYKHMKERRQKIGKYPFIFKRALKLKSNSPKKKETKSNLKIETSNGSIKEAPQITHLNSGSFVRLSMNLSINLSYSFDLM